jgi:hypothetical protein
VDCLSGNTGIGLNMGFAIEQGMTRNYKECYKIQETQNVRKFIEC